MRLRSLIAVAIAVAVAALLAATQAPAQGPAGATQQPRTGAPHARPIDPIVPPVRRVMPVTPPPSRDIKGVDHGAKARRGKAGTPAPAKAGKVGKAAKAHRGSSAHRGCGKGRKGKPSCLGAGELAAAIGSGEARPAPKPQASVQTGPTR